MERKNRPTKKKNINRAFGISKETLPTPTQKTRALSTACSERPRARRRLRRAATAASPLRCPQVAVEEENDDDVVSEHLWRINGRRFREWQHRRRGTEHHHQDHPVLLKIALPLLAVAYLLLVEFSRLCPRKGGPLRGGSRHIMCDVGVPDSSCSSTRDRRGVEHTRFE